MNIINYRVESINGTAKAGEDFVKIKEIIEFNENEEEKEVLYYKIKFILFLHFFVYTLDSRRNT